VAARELRPPPVYAIADAEALGSTPLVEAFAAMAEAGLAWIQVRAKRLADDLLFRALEACSRVAEEQGVALWVDDRVDLAAMLPVAGVHLGQHDLPPAEARKIVGERILIGWSTHDWEQAARAQDDPAVDVIALGPIFPTTGKENPDPVVGLGELERVASRISKPLVAIGGIDKTNVAQVLQAGADSAAVLGAVCRGPVPENARALLRAVRGG
jgi:thiamine-phosphate pyrophosphorylase